MLKIIESVASTDLNQNEAKLFDDNVDYTKKSPDRPYSYIVNDSKNKLKLWLSEEQFHFLVNDVRAENKRREREQYCYNVPDEITGKIHAKCPGFYLTRNEKGQVIKLNCGECPYCRNGKTNGGIVRADDLNSERFSKLASNDNGSLNDAIYEEFIERLNSYSLEFGAKENKVFMESFFNSKSNIKLGEELGITEGAVRKILKKTTICVFSKFTDDKMEEYTKCLKERENHFHRSDYSSLK